MTSHVLIYGLTSRRTVGRTWFLPSQSVVSCSWFDIVLQEVSWNFNLNPKKKKETEVASENAATQRIKFQHLQNQLALQSGSYTNPVFFFLFFLFYFPSSSLLKQHHVPSRPQHTLTTSNRAPVTPSQDEKKKLERFCSFQLILPELFPGGQKV